MPSSPTTTEKALALLGFFSDQRPLIGLSEFARLSGLNKATALRHLTSLEHHGFVEKTGRSRRLPARPCLPCALPACARPLYPQSDAVTEVVRAIMQATGETAHASEFSGAVLMNIRTIETDRSNRVFIKPGEAMPFHASASGIVFTAFCDADLAG